MRKNNRKTVLRTLKTAFLIFAQKSIAEPCPAFGPSSGKHLAAVRSTHSGAEAMNLLPMDLFGLICSFHSGNPPFLWMIRYLPDNDPNSSSNAPRLKKSAGTGAKIPFISKNPQFRSILDEQGICQLFFAFLKNYPKIPHFFILI